VNASGFCRTVVRDHDIRPRGEIECESTSVRSRHIRRTRALAAIPDVELGLAAPRRTVRRLDLQHIGTLVGQELAEVLAGDAVRDLEDAEAG
jgi:hypothetical protein